MRTSAVRVAVGGYRQSSPRFEATGKLWPNGEFSLGYRRVGESTTEGEEWLWTGGKTGLAPSELDDRLECLHGWLDAVGEVCSVSARQALVRLNSSSVCNSHETPPPRKNGLKGLTGYGGKMLRSGCYLMEQKLGTNDCCFTTLTVPVLPREQRIRLAQGWGVLTNRLVQFLSRRLVTARRPTALAGCAEVQSRRLEKYREAYLHLHILHPAFSNAPGQTWAVDVDELRTWWKAAIERVINYTLPCDPRIEMAQVELSVERYLSKYLSKGDEGAMAAYIADLGEESVPGQWWFMSACLKAKVKECTHCGRNAGVILDTLVNHLLEVGTGEGFDYIRHIDCMLGDRPVTVGFVGKLTKGLAEDVRAMLDKRPATI